MPGVRVAVLFSAGIGETIETTVAAGPSEAVVTTIRCGRFRASARHVFEDGGFVVVGEAQDGASGLAAASTMRPTGVLLDVQLPDCGGSEVAAQLTSQDDGPAVVLTSSRDASELGGMVARSGARGFVPKDELAGPALEADRPAPGADRRRTPHHGHGATCMRVVLGEDPVLVREGSRHQAHLEYGLERRH